MLIIVHLNKPVYFIIINFLDYTALNTTIHLFTTPYTIQHHAPLHLIKYL